MRYMLVSIYDELVLIGYQELDFRTDENSCKSTSRYVYTFQVFVVTKETKEAIWLQMFLI